MDHTMYDDIARAFKARPSRRALARALGVAGASMVGAATTTAKKAKKAKLCLNGQTVSASKKKKKKLLKQGATPGACCVPQCNGASCGGDNACGGVCGCNAGAVCHSGACKACNVTCSGTDIACGLALSAALAGGGEVVACPGRYAGNFTMKVNGASLVGAGPGRTRPPAQSSTGRAAARSLRSISTCLSRCPACG